MDLKYHSSTLVDVSSTFTARHHCHWGLFCISSNSRSAWLLDLKSWHQSKVDINEIEQNTETFRLRKSTRRAGKCPEVLCSWPKDTARCHRQISVSVPCWKSMENKGKLPISACHVKTSTCFKNWKIYEDLCWAPARLAARPLDGAKKKIIQISEDTLMLRYSLYYHPTIALRVF